MIPWIVICRSVEELVPALRDVPGARFLRALDASRAVVLAPPVARKRLAALPGVQDVREDTLEHPDHHRSTTGSILGPRDRR